MPSTKNWLRLLGLRWMLDLPPHWRYKDLIRNNWNLQLILLTYPLERLQLLYSLPLHLRVWRLTQKYIPVDLEESPPYTQTTILSTLFLSGQKEKRGLFLKKKPPTATEKGKKAQLSTSPNFSWYLECIMWVQYQLLKAPYQVAYDDSIWVQYLATPWDK